MRTLGLCLLVFLGSAMASYEGYATDFDAVGYPYGACGVPDSVAWSEGVADTPSGQGNPFHYVALNVFDDSGNYSSASTFGNRPLTGADTAFLGMYRNGRNCGRWIRVRLGDYCTGTNDGAVGKTFCRGGNGWVSDSLDGAWLDAIVLDQCTDNNAWCRDAKYHLDLHTPDLAAFQLGGKLVALATANDTPATISTSYTVKDGVFNNRKISWDFETAPNYRGEPRFYFSVDSKDWYMRIIVTHLPDGIHAVEQYTGGAWKPATMQGDMGQLWILPDPSVTTFKLRLRDVDDSLVMAGRTWTVDYPAACGKSCTGAAPPADNVVGEGGDVSVSPKVRAAASARLRVQGRTLELAAPGAREVEFLDMTGSVIGRAFASDGAASWTASRPGLVVARWRGTQGSGALNGVVP